MRTEYISSISKRDVLTHRGKYLWLQVPKEYANTNFSLLLDFIEKYSDCGKNKKYGNAYCRIRQVTNKLYGVGKCAPLKLKTSKHEIKSIRKSVVSKINGKNYIKIPYKIAYIFKALICIIDEIEQDNNIGLPDDLRQTINLAYGIAFYDRYIEVYDTYYDDLQEKNIIEFGYTLKVALYNDFHSENSVFSTIVK